LRGRLGILACIVLLLPACASAPPGGDRQQSQELGVKGMVIRNELAYPVTQVMINVPATGAFAGCGNILPRSECSTTFQRIGYRGNPLVVSWREYGAAHQTDEFVVEPPAVQEPGQELVLEVVVFAPGQAGARLVPVP